MQSVWRIPFLHGLSSSSKDLEGTLDAEALKAAGVPFGPLFGKIKNGQDVELEDGRLICAKDYISAPKRQNHHHYRRYAQNVCQC